MSFYMNHKLRLILTVIIVVAIIIFVSTFLALKNNSPAFLWRPRPVNPSIMGDIEVYYTLKTIISSVNTTLLVILLTVYIDLYSKTKSEFTLGLMIFSMALLFYAVSSNPMFQMVFGFQALGLGPFAMLPDLFSFVAVTVLTYLSLKY